jgi:hypothetical protein
MFISKRLNSQLRAYKHHFLGCQVFLLDSAILYKVIGHGTLGMLLLDGLGLPLDLCSVHISPLYRMAIALYKHRHSVKHDIKRWLSDKAVVALNR